MPGKNGFALVFRGNKVISWAYAGYRASSSDRKLLYVLRGEALAGLGAEEQVFVR